MRERETANLCRTNEGFPPSSNTYPFTAIFTTNFIVRENGKTNYLRVGSDGFDLPQILSSLTCGWMEIQ